MVQNIIPLSSLIFSLHITERITKIHLHLSKIIILLYIILIFILTHYWPLKIFNPPLNWALITFQTFEYRHYTPRYVT